MEGGKITKNREASFLKSSPSMRPQNTERNSWAANMFLFLHVNFQATIVKSTSQEKGNLAV